MFGPQAIGMGMAPPPSPLRMNITER